MLDGLLAKLCACSRKRSIVFCHSILIFQNTEQNWWADAVGDKAQNIAHKTVNTVSTAPEPSGILTLTIDELQVLHNRNSKN